jgi:hypothetical protein
MPETTPNVTLGNDLSELKQSIPCFLCRGAVAIRWDKNQKPYFICDGCGIQAFIRRKGGINLLKKLQGKSFSSLEIIQLTRELVLLTAEKAKLSSQHGILGLFSPGEEIIKAEQAIIQKIAIITAKIKDFAEKKTPR